MWTPGSQLRSRPYLIESILGQGGFGITYKARHLQLDYLVALKTPNQSLQNDPQYHRFVQRFVQEGQILAKVCRYHQAIVRVSDLFDEYGLPCLVMDWVDGKSLYDKVGKRGALSENKAVAIIRQIGEALVEVHKAGIVHRDAHPGNIMLRGNGSAVLIDFGIATGLIPTVFTSMHPANRGFAPWEQWIEGSGKPTVDIYTLAASLYYAVTGTIPTSSEQRRFQNAYLQPARDFGVSERVSRAIEKGMASDPDRRPESMGEWLSYLDYSPATISQAAILSPLPRMHDIDFAEQAKRVAEAFGPGPEPNFNAFIKEFERSPAPPNRNRKTTSRGNNTLLDKCLLFFILFFAAVHGYSFFQSQKEFIISGLLLWSMILTCCSLTLNLSNISCIIMLVSSLSFFTVGNIILDFGGNFYPELMGVWMGASIGVFLVSFTSLIMKK